MSVKGEELWARLQKKPQTKAAPKPMKQVGRVGQARKADRTAKLKAEPADHSGRRQCYIGLEMTTAVVLEHVIDASVRPDLRHDPRNQRWACVAHNERKKMGTLTLVERARVEKAEAEVLS